MAHSQSGFTIVELMIVVGIVAVISISFAGYLYQQSKLTNANQNRQDFTSLQNNVLNCAGSSNCLLQSEDLSK